MRNGNGLGLQLGSLVRFRVMAWAGSGLGRPRSHGLRILRLAYGSPQYISVFYAFGIRICTSASEYENRKKTD